MFDCPERMAEILASSDDASKRRNHVGSYFGSKYTFLITLSGMGLGTGAIGLIPTYEAKPLARCMVPIEMWPLVVSTLSSRTLNATPASFAAACARFS